VRQYQQWDVYGNDLQAELELRGTSVAVQLREAWLCYASHDAV